MTLKANRIYQTLSILASKPIVDLSTTSFRTILSWSIYVSAGSDDGIDPLSGEQIDFAPESYKNENRLIDAIRRDLGVDPRSA